MSWLSLIATTVTGAIHVAKWLKKRWRVYRSRRIRRLVDSGDTVALDDFLRDLQKIRQDREDAN